MDLVSFEANLVVSLRRDLIASICDTVENGMEHSVFGCFEYRTISLSNERKKKRQREREKEKR